MRVLDEGAIGSVLNEKLQLLPENHTVVNVSITRKYVVIVMVLLIESIRNFFTGGFSSARLVVRLLPRWVASFVRSVEMEVLSTRCR